MPPNACEELVDTISRLADPRCCVVAAVARAPCCCASSCFFALTSARAFRPRTAACIFTAAASCSARSCFFTSASARALRPRIADCIFTAAASCSARSCFFASISARALRPRATACILTAAASCSATSCRLAATSARAFRPRAAAWMRTIACCSDSSNDGSSAVAIPWSRRRAEVARGDRGGRWFCDRGERWLGDLERDRDRVDLVPPFVLRCLCGLRALGLCPGGRVGCLACFPASATDPSLSGVSLILMTNVGE